MRFLLLLALLAPFKLSASIELESGSFSQDFVDLKLNGTYEFRRFYQSQNSNKKSKLLGYGWCYEVEDKLDLKNKKEVTYHSCQNGPITFQPKGREYHPLAHSDVSLQKKRDKYLITMASGKQMTFNKKGKLTHVELDGTKYKVVHKGKKVTAIKVGANNYRFKKKKGSLTILLKKKELVKNSLKDNLLVSGKNEWGNTYTYRYDNSKRLWGINIDNRGILKVGYNKNGYANMMQNFLSKCAWSVAYSQKENTTYAVEKELCGQNKVSRKHVYTYQDNGQRNLASVSTTENGKLLSEVTYSKGEEVISRDGKTETIQRDSLGRVSSYSDGQYNFFYRYAGQNREPIEVKWSGLESKTTKYSYAKDGSVKAIIAKGEPKIKIFSGAKNYGKVVQYGKLMLKVNRKGKVMVLNGKNKFKNDFEMYNEASKVLYATEHSLMPLKKGGVY